MIERFITPKSILLFANGEPPSLTLFNRYKERADRLFALDGASTWLMNHGITPDLVIGDLDSVDPSLLKNLLQHHVANQNSNDLEKALIYCREKRYFEITVLGAFGKRADHFLTNLYVVKKFAPHLLITLVDDEQCAFICPLKTNVELFQQTGKYISLFPLEESVGPIWSSGVDYPLDNEMLSITTRIGTLNRINHEHAKLYCEKGALAVFIPQTVVAN